MSVPTDHKRALGQVAERLDISVEDFEQLGALAFSFIDRKRSQWAWLAVGLRSGALDHGELFADLVTEAMSVMHTQGVAPPEAMLAAMKPWGREAFQRANVYQPGKPGAQATLPGYEREQLWGVTHQAHVEDEDYDRIIEAVDSARLLSRIRDTLTDEEWQWLVDYAETGSLAALGEHRGMTPNGVRHQVRKVQQRVADLGFCAP